MAFRLLHPHINYRVFTTFLIVGLVLLVGGGVVVLGVGQAQLREAFGMHLAQEAERSAASIDAYVFRRIIDVSQLARVPDIRAAAAAGSGEPFDARRVEQLDREWQQSRAVPEPLAGVLANPAARFLREIVSVDPIYREILVTDRYGRLVAASGATSDYYQADENWWVESFDDGVLGRVTVSDVHWDESARVYAVEIAAPVPGADGDIDGVLKVVADVRELLAAVAGMQMGVTGEATVIRPDGSTVLSRRPLDPGARFFAADLLRERLQRAEQGDPEVRFAFAARTSQGERHLIGVAPSQLGMSYPELNWLVAVSQAEHELFGPVRTQMWHLIVFIALLAVAVLSLALWFSMRLAAPAFDVDMGLVEHPRIHRIDEEEQDIAS